MKKLALALVCLVSVAFFASCDPTTDQPEPSIAILSGLEYVNGTVDNPQIIPMDDNVDWKFGFHVESNAVTKVELKSLKVTWDYIMEDGQLGSWEETVDLTGKTSYDYEDKVFSESKVIIFENTVRATVTDANGQVNTAALAYKIDMEDMPLDTYSFTWVRDGGGQIVGTGLDEFGLEWLSNLREIYAVITPKADATLYLFQPEVWNQVNTEFEKADLFNEQSMGVNQFKAVSCTAPNKDYDLVIGTNYDGEIRLIHVTHSTAVNNPPYGTKVTITGEWK